VGTIYGIPFAVIVGSYLDAVTHLGEMHGRYLRTYLLYFFETVPDDSLSNRKERDPRSKTLDVLEKRLGPGDRRGAGDQTHD